MTTVPNWRKVRLLLCGSAATPGDNSAYGYAARRSRGGMEPVASASRT